jgi:D-alanyl-D-alanine carboxypeptidase
VTARTNGWQAAARGVAACLLFVTSAAAAAGQTQDRARRVARIDSIVRAALESGRVAGLTVGVVVGNDTLMLRGYGHADLELDVATPPRAIYEIGSVTKQFTAAAVLQLWEQGKLDLDADITAYLPTYATQSHRIPLRRLLDHTSGIRGYTELPAFRGIASRALPRDSLVALFQHEPFDFAPGEALIYNNSAYFLLGLIIEKVSGGTYADYVQRHLFGPTGMTDSRYCSNTAIVKGRAKGYTATPAGLQRAEHMDHTWPFAAGSLCSTAADLITWTRALHAGRVLSERAYRELITPGTLNDGTPVRYAKGLGRNLVAGHPAIAHGGGIPGYASDLVYMPDHDAVIVVLMNTIGGGVDPRNITEAIVRLIFGPRGTTPAVPYTGDAATLAGTFRGRGRGMEMTMRVTVTDGGLQVFRAASTTPVTLEHVGDGVFRAGNRLFRFRITNGRATHLIADEGGSVLVLQRVE